MTNENEFEWCPIHQRDELKIYNTLLDKSIAGRAGRIMPNSGQFHAALMMSKLFDQTTNSVNMIVGSFSGEVSEQPNYQAALDRLLKKQEIEVNVLVLDKLNIDSTTYKKLISKRLTNKKIELKKATPQTTELLLSSFVCEEPLNFSVFDDDKFRLEISPKTFSAFGSFNDKVRACKLLSTFRDIYQTAEIIN